MGKVEEKDDAEDAEGAEARGSGNVDCGGGAEKFGLAVQCKKPRYHAGLVNVEFRS